ncbi:unnamed protein product [Meganyctiphanes norvegica]|uniref:receptor protein-tyrosine kinase n=1 Tax=Meganyctiphanes norvegica TaxID=48144 RepID=A0AAV2PMR6_MEGNR
MCVPKNMICDLHKDCEHGEDENVCIGYPEGARCDFEAGMCGWKNNNKDEMDWTHYQGSGTNAQRGGPSGDHTLLNGTGWYMLSKLPQLGSLSEQAILESPVFDPPPCYHRDQSSELYESCRIRLFYHKEGRNQGSLRLEVIERDGSREGNTRLLKQLTGDQGGQWKILFKPVPATVTHPYQVRVINVRAMRSTGDMGLDDISLSPECFGLGVAADAAAACPVETTTEAVPAVIPPEDGVGWLMTTCGARGREGPGVDECKKAYHDFPQPHAAVTEDKSVSMVKGLQKWKVPADGYYALIAQGASGGTGVQSQDQRSKGSWARGVFYLKAKDALYIMVGQEGESACEDSEAQSTQGSSSCHERSDPPHDDNFDQMNEVEQVRKMSKSIYGGGGGGGGASIVYKVVDGKATPLVVAGGGGGLAWVNTTVKDTQNGRGINSSLQDTHGLATYNVSYSGAGPGGGWRGTSTSNGSEGQSLLKGGRGGDLCKGNSILVYRGFGGYGGGGGACLAGGGGGGYTGEQMSYTKTKGD